MENISAVIVATETNCGGLYCNLATIPRCKHALERKNLANVLENISTTSFSAIPFMQNIALMQKLGFKTKLRF